MSYARQRVSIITIHKKGSVNRPKLNIYTIRRTGFANITFPNGATFLYNIKRTYSSVKDIDFAEIINFQNQTGKRVIFVRKR